MDCRKGLLFVVGLLVPLSGCTLHPAGEVRKEGGAPAGEPVIKKPETFVAFADYRAAAAVAPETPPEARQAYRDEARMGYLKAIEVEPKHVPAYLALARLQQSGGDMAPAVETYTKALEVTTKDATLWYELGMCQARQKQFDEAVASLQKACELRPDDKKCRETMGYTLARAGRWAEALTTLTGVLGEARAQFALARMLQHMNRTEEARQYAAAALSHDPELPGARELLASVSGQAATVSPVPTPAEPGTPAAREGRLPPRPVSSLSAAGH